MVYKLLLKYKILYYNGYISNGYISTSINMITLVLMFIHLNSTYQHYMSSVVMAHDRLDNMLLEDDSDNEFHMLATLSEGKQIVNKDKTSHRPGSIVGHAIIQRDRVQGNDRLYRDYFADTPTYGPHLFRRRF